MTKYVSSGITDLELVQDEAKDFGRRERHECKANFYAIPRTVEIATRTVRVKIQRRNRGAQQPKLESKIRILGVASKPRARRNFTRYREQYKWVRERFA